MYSPRARPLTAIFLLILCLTASSLAQQLSPAATKLRTHAQSIPSGSRVSIVFLHQQERFGTFVSADETTFRIHDVDTREDLAIPYSEVRRIKLGYGGYNSAVHRHTDRTRNLIIAAAVLGGLFALIVAAAHS